MQNAWLVNSNDLVAALEEYIAKVKNPKTPKDWNDFMEWMQEFHKPVEHLGYLPDEVTPGYLAGSLRDEGINAKVFKPNKEENQNGL